MDKKLKIGVFGARRGRGIAQGLTLTEKAYISAVCDYDESTYENIKPFCCDETKYYKDFEEFIDSGMDAVVLTNFFHQHAKYAVIALEKGIHVQRGYEICPRKTVCCLCRALPREPFSSRSCKRVELL